MAPPLPMTARRTSCSCSAATTAPPMTPTPGPGPAQLGAARANDQPGIADRRFPCLRPGQRRPDAPVRGYNGAGYLQDTWSWSGTSWTALTPAAKPSVREEGSFAYDTSSSQMLLFGGYNSGDLADTWSWTGTTWSALTRHRARRLAMGRRWPIFRR